MNCQSKTLFEIVLLFLVISFFSFNTSSSLSTFIKNIIYNDVGFILSMILTIYFVVKKEFIYLAIVLFIIIKHSRVLEGAGEAGAGEAGSGEAGAGEAGSGEAGSGEAGAGEAGSGEAPEEDEVGDAKKKSKAEAKAEAKAIKSDLGVEKNMLNDGGKIESFWDLIAQSRRNANKILNSASTM